MMSLLLLQYHVTTADSGAKSDADSKFHNVY